MKQKNLVFGGSLLVAGTSIGAGMLALPAITSFGGFVPSVVLFTLVWALMLATAFFFLDVNLSMKGEHNFISLAGKTLGKEGKAISWIFYLLLLYALLAAYISACVPLFSFAFSSLFSIEISPVFAAFILPTLFGGFIYLGTKGVDYLNRLFMLGLIVSYFFLCGGLPEHVEPARLLHQDILASFVSLPVIMTSFGYHIIIPTLVTYMNHKVSLLRRALLIGSIIPFIVYLLWQILALGSLPLPMLTDAWQSGSPITESLAKAFQSPWIGSIARFFSFFAIITSFLGISLSLSDFLTDGLRIKKTWEGKLLAIFLTFMPPLIFIFSCKNSFYIALDYAGAFVSILLGILPSLMALSLKHHKWYQSLYGKMMVYLVIFLCFVIVIINIFEQQGYLKSLFAPYLK